MIQLLSVQHRFFASECDFSNISFSLYSFIFFSIAYLNKKLLNHLKFLIIQVAELSAYNKKNDKTIFATSVFILGNSVHCWSCLSCLFTTALRIRNPLILLLMGILHYVLQKVIIYPICGVFSKNKMKRKGVLEFPGFLHSRKKKI